MNYDNTTPVPFHKSHSHFFDYIEEFPQTKKVQDKIERIEKEVSIEEVRYDILRKELIEFTKNKKATEDYVCYRKCFKNPERSIVEFCLERTCNANFNTAAKALNLLKL